ncbi:glycosyltransferase family 2 protein [Kluyvera intermedia]|uniref:glycosyltransferase family 2 protein n=1 Tax=Kluyvera intermedia TaxID=61648 RepID=UPI00078952DD|nr:glycosyltransferase family 2 protein [Kluyvera intermedia]WQD31284.1 glycosyltransferase family 2 protein [Kluyvera intermedia]VDZ82577.1 putative glycosyl transferase [Kluyvera intermedia]
MMVSFCIPTYNRKEFLEELLKSINNQKKPNFDIEVCISDNASTDGTESMIEIWREDFNFPIVYHRNSENLGPDTNFLASVSLATGDYCWIFGSDDVLADDALITLESYLHSNADIYLCDRSETGYDLSELRNAHRHWLSAYDELYILDSDKDRTNYFKRCLSIGGVFSYLSSLVVKRAKWFAVDFDQSFIGSSYPHVFIMMNIFNNQSCRLHYLAKPLVVCRGDNDSFENKGKANRVIIDFSGYFKLSDTLYPNNQMLQMEFEKILLRERPWLYTSLAISCYGDREEKEVISSFYKRLGHSEYLTFFVFKFCFFSRVLKNNRMLKTILKKFLS